MKKKKETLLVEIKIRMVHKLKRKMRNLRKKKERRKLINLIQKKRNKLIKSPNRKKRSLFSSFQQSPSLQFSKLKNN